MLRLVLDTNVVLDLVHWGNAEAAPILAALADARIECLADERTLEELQRVLAGAQLGLTPDAAGDRYRRYRALARPLPSGDVPPLPRCKDRDDQKFLELAARAGADLLVSRDNALLRLRGRTRLAFRIVAPAAAVALLPPAMATDARSLPS
jgi:predicted nucleic acid-binding protein